MVISMRKDGASHCVKSVSIPPRQNKSAVDPTILQCESRTFMGGNINGRPQDYMHIEGVATRNTREVSEAIKMDYRTHEQRWWTARDNAIWESLPRNLKRAPPRAPRDEATLHDWRFRSVCRIDYLWVPAGAKTGLRGDLRRCDHRAMICRVTMPQVKAFKKVAWVPAPEWGQGEWKVALQLERGGARVGERADPVGRLDRWSEALRGQAPARPTGAAHARGGEASQPGVRKMLTRPTRVGAGGLGVGVAWAHVPQAATQPQDSRG